MGGDSAEDAAPTDDGERGGSSSADEASSARPTPESSSAGGGVADATQQHASSGANLGNGDVDVARGGAAGASGGETRSENPAPPQPIAIPGRSGHHRGRHRRGKSRGGSGSGSGWGSYGGGSGDGFGRFGWGSATIDEWVMSGWPPSQSNTPRTGSFSAPGYDPFAASPRAGSFSAGSAPGPAGASPRGFAWWQQQQQQQQQPTSPVQDRAGRLSRGSIVFDPDDLVPSPRQSRANSRGFPGASASSATLTVYVREIPSGASEGDVHDHFYTCGSVRECRVSADPHSQSTPDGGVKKRVAFVAFETENAVRQALTMDGSLLLGEPIRVMPSRTEVMPVDPGLLPRTDEERERCTRTVYVSNVDPDVRSQDLRSALERVADGKIAALHLQARKNNKGKGPRRNAHTDAADEERQRKATSVAFAEFCDVDAALRAIDATGRLTVGSLPVFVAASKTPLKPPKKSRRSHFASAEVSSTMSAATAASTGVTSTTNESGDTGDTEMIHEDEDDIHEDEDEDAAYAYEDGSLDDAIREGGTRDVPDDDRADSDETYEDDAPSASPPNGSETTTTTTTTTDSPVSVAPPETNDETEATTTKMGKLTVGGGDAEVIPLVDETEFPPLGR